MESGLGLKGIFSHQKIYVIARILPLPPTYLVLQDI